MAKEKQRKKQTKNNKKRKWSGILTASEPPLRENGVIFLVNRGHQHFLLLFLLSLPAVCLFCFAFLELLDALKASSRKIYEMTSEGHVIVKENNKQNLLWEN